MTQSLERPWKLELFEKSKTEGVVMIGEIGGQMENEAALWAKKI